MMTGQTKKYKILTRKETFQLIDLWNMGASANEIVKCTNYLTKKQVLGTIWRLRRKFPYLFTRKPDPSKNTRNRQKILPRNPYEEERYL